MWELDHKKGWALKNWCFWIVVLEKALESPLDCKEIKPVNPKGNQLWIFVRSTDAEAEAPIFWPPNVKSWLIGKDPDAGEDWRQEEKGMTEDEMVGWVVSPTQWTWVWASSKRWWRTMKPGMLQSTVVAKSWTQLTDWTTTKNSECFSWDNHCTLIGRGNIVMPTFSKLLAEAPQKHHQELTGTPKASVHFQGRHHNICWIWAKIHLWQESRVASNLIPRFEELIQWPTGTFHS